MRDAMFGVRLTLERTATHHSNQCYCFSLREGKICLTRAGDIHGFRLPRAFVPGDDVVLAIGNVVDFVVPAGISQGEVWRRTDNDVAGLELPCLALQQNHSHSSATVKSTNCILVIFSQSDARVRRDNRRAKKSMRGSAV